MLTYDVENVPVEALSRHPQRQTFPATRPALLAAGQDRLSEKTLFNELKIPTTRFRPIDSMPDFEEAIHDIGYPRSAEDPAASVADVASGAILVLRNRSFQRLTGVPLILEEFIPFEREVSPIGVRTL